MSYELRQTLEFFIYLIYKLFQNMPGRWLTSVIPAAQKVEISRISVQGQPRKKVSKTPSQPIKLSSQLYGRHK
jgi:hypothetical protein